MRKKEQDALLPEGSSDLAAIDEEKLDEELKKARAALEEGEEENFLTRMYKDEKFLKEK